jgi:elongation factor G
VPAVNKGIQEQMENGVLAGFPLVDMNFTIWPSTYLVTVHLDLL